MVAIIRCGGGHSAVVLEAILQSCSKDDIVVWDDSGKTHQLLAGYKVVTTCEEVLEVCKGQLTHVYVCNGNPRIREQLVTQVRDVLRDEKFDFPNAIHRQAFISPSATLGEGNYVGPFAIVNTCVSIGSFCIINSSVTVDHDCILEDYATLNPGSVLCGTVFVHRSAVLGANTSGECFYLEFARSAF
jgi:sugar O-acyltransferase (sialic acid O-acetyltransferase NeuD family)